MIDHDIYLSLLPSPFALFRKRKEEKESWLFFYKEKIFLFFISLFDRRSRRPQQGSDAIHRCAPSPLLRTPKRCISFCLERKTK